MVSDRNFLIFETNYFKEDLNGLRSPGLQLSLIQAYHCISLLKSEWKTFQLELKSFCEMFQYVFSPFSTKYSVFFYSDNIYSVSVAYLNGRAFYALNEWNYLPNEVVYIAIYSVRAE